MTWYDQEKSCRGYSDRALWFPPPTKYNLGVLIGPWVEERHCFSREPLVHRSTYAVDFTGYSPPGDKRALLGNREKGAGLEQALLFDYEGDKYLENFSTTYDLSYNHLSKRCERAQELLRNYGNLTKYGLVEHKRYEWENDAPDPRTTNVSAYKVDFVEPPSRTGRGQKDEYRQECSPITWECKVVCANRK